MEGSPSSPLAAGVLFTPGSRCVSEGWGLPRCQCWPSPGNSRAWSPPGARRPSASPPTAGEIRRTPRSLDPAALGSSCCWFLHPTEPSGPQSQAGCGHHACVPTHQTSIPLALSPPTSERLIFIPFPPGCTHSPLPSVSDAAALAQQHAGVPCREGRITSQLQDLDTITWYWLSCRIDPHTRGQL